MKVIREIIERLCRVGALAILAVSIGLSASPLADAAPVISWVPFDMPKLQQTVLKSLSGAPYRIVVATPAGPAATKGYPVIYVLDGNAWTGFVSEIIRVSIGLGTQSRVEPAMVVGIGYPINAAVDLSRRNLDLTSPVPPDYSPPSGDHMGPVGGDVSLMEFIDGAHW